MKDWLVKLRVRDGKTVDGAVHALTVLDYEVLSLKPLTPEPPPRASEAPKNASSASSEEKKPRRARRSNGTRKVVSGIRQIDFIHFAMKKNTPPRLSKRQGQTILLEQGYHDPDGKSTKSRFCELVGFGMAFEHVEPAADGTMNYELTKKGISLDKAPKTERRNRY